MRAILGRNLPLFPALTDSPLLPCPLPVFRCVLNWFGDWSTEALYQVGKEFTSKMDLEKPNYKVPDYMPIIYDKMPQPPTHREAIVNGCVFVHQTLHQVGLL